MLSHPFAKCANGWGNHKVLLRLESKNALGHFEDFCIRAVRDANQEKATASRFDGRIKGEWDPGGGGYFPAPIDIFQCRASVTSFSLEPPIDIVGRKEIIFCNRLSDPAAVEETQMLVAGPDS
jgi:hypothetical protein